RLRHMLKKETLEEIKKYVHPFRITKGKGFRLKDFDPGDMCGLKLDKGKPQKSCNATLHCWRRSRTCSTPRIAGPCCSSFKRWTRPAKTARSSTSCRASILRAARYSRSSSPRRKNSTTTSCGARSDTSPSADASASSTAHTTKKSSSCAYIPKY